MTLRRAAILLHCLVSLAGPPARAGTLCTIVADAATGQTFRQEGDCARRVTPASTFKIAISLMGFDAGILKDEHDPAWPFEKGYPDWLPAWRQTTDPTSWIRNSVVWYSQQVTRRLGEERFARAVAAFHYGNADVSGDAGQHNGLTRAWLSSSLRISPLEQVAFLENLVRRRLPVTPHAYDMTERVTSLGLRLNGWTIHGKTGSGFPKLPDGSNDKAHGFGWFVGWAAKGERAIVFARLLQDEKQEPVSAGYRARDGLMNDVMQASPPILDPR